MVENLEIKWKSQKRELIIEEHREYWNGLALASRVKDTN